MSKRPLISKFVSKFLTYNEVERIGNRELLEYYVIQNNFLTTEEERQIKGKILTPSLYARVVNRAALIQRIKQHAFLTPQIRNDMLAFVNKQDPSKRNVYERCFQITLRHYSSTTIRYNIKSLLPLYVERCSLFGCGDQVFIHDHRHQLIGIVDKNKQCHVFNDHVKLYEFLKDKFSIDILLYYKKHEYGKEETNAPSVSFKRARRQTAFKPR
jgi:hypothetical protein